MLDPVDMEKEIARKGVEAERRLKLEAERQKRQKRIDKILKKLCSDTLLEDDPNDSGDDGDDGDNKRERKGKGKLPKPFKIKELDKWEKITQMEVSKKVFGIKFAKIKIPEPPEI